MLRDDITDGRHGVAVGSGVGVGGTGSRRGRGRRFRRRLHIGQEDDVGIIRLIVARRILAGYLKLNLTRDARFQIEHERPAFAGRQGGNGRNRRTRFFDGQGRRVRLADVFHLHSEADDRGFAVNGGGLRLRGHVEHQRLARVLRGDVQFGRRDGNGFAVSLVPTTSAAIAPLCTGAHSTVCSNVAPAASSTSEASTVPSASVAVRPV